MGYVKHDVLIVTGYDEDITKKMHKKCIKLFGSNVTEIQTSKANFCFSFFVGTSGSKLGWETQQDWESACEDFMAYLSKQRKKYFQEKGHKSSLCDVVHLTYGGDDWSTSIDCPEDF